MRDDIGKLIDDMASGIEAPDVATVRGRAAKRKRLRQGLAGAVAVAAFAGLISLAIGVWPIGNEGAQVATQDAPSAGAQAIEQSRSDDGPETSAIISGDTAEQTLIRGHRWLVLAREGIPQPVENSHEELMFLESPDRLILSNCTIAVHPIEWNLEGFVLSPANPPPGGNPSGIECPPSSSGILDLTVSPEGVQVNVERRDDSGTVLISTPEWSLVTRRRGPIDADASPSTAQDLELLSFLAPLERGRWSFLEGSDSYPDGDEPDQGIAFWTLKEPGDRLILYGRPCFSAQVFLEWLEPGLAVVTEDQSDIEILSGDIRCSRSPGIANHPPAVGSLIRVTGDGEVIDVSVSQDGQEEWSARFEYQQFHLLEDS